MLLIIALVLGFWVQMPHVYEQRWGLAAVALFVIFVAQSLDAAIVVLSRRF